MTDHQKPNPPVLDITFAAPADAVFEPETAEEHAEHQRQLQASRQALAVRAAIPRVT